ncbi:MAG TPA: D-aminoacylase [Blastocatellia bacterium]|nr:D-aminoacylase [Blastocatellia bacterium]HMV82854.1 D-aminoacylase [Blastocatellia bacterium]HMX24757.1 D-aminoacylase [Blastocatellia bacterium]HNG29599.1 D-aminoacylase [Blastocatellia bacterium]
MRKLLIALSFVLILLGGAAAQSGGEYDVLIKNGTVYDGTGGKPRRADVLIRGDKIVAVGDFKNAKAKTVVDAAGLAVAPGFVNMLSHSYNSILTDGRSLGELRQGVTTQIFGEGSSMGPLTEEMKQRRGITGWTTLAEYLSFAEKKGISQNIASYIGATTIREYVIGLEDKKATPEQLAQMRQLVKQEMEAGALGIGSSLIYAPAFYASTEELIEMCKVAAQYKGKYISHMRSEGNQLIEAVEELLRIAREAGIPAEIYHLKASGEANWPKMDQVIKMVEQARKQGLKVTADMYTYTAGSTGLNSTLPPWTLDGGYEALFKRLQDPATRQKIAAEVRTPTNSWENMYLLAGSPERILLVGFRNAALRQYIGKSLAEVAKLRGKDPIETIMDLIVEDRSRVDTVYFMMSEENVKKQLKLPWVSFGSDAASMAAEGVFLNSSTHPRAYGNFARLLGKYVRDEKVISLEEAIRRLAYLPATNLGLDHRGLLKTDYFADVVIFDPKTIADRATFEKPHQYSVGMQHVFVNGQHVLKDGEHTGTKPGRALWGPGKVK